MKESQRCNQCDRKLWLQIRISLMLIIVHVLNDSLSQVMYEELLKTRVISVKSFVSVWMKGRWFIAKTHKLDSDGWRENNTRASAEGTSLTGNHWSFVFSFFSERTSQQMVDKGEQAGMTDRIVQYLPQMTSKLSHRAWTMICGDFKTKPSALSNKEQRV